MNLPEPRRVVVAGGGIVGLSCAWHLLQHGVEVTVVDRSSVGAGASWGNAGWLSPSLAVPLPEPGLLREGLRGLTDRDSPLAVDPWPTAPKTAFLVDFARNATTRRWREGMAGLSALNRVALAAFDDLAAAGVDVRTHETDIRIGFRRGESDHGLVHELEAVRAAGQLVDYRSVEPEPPFSSRIERTMVLRGQRYVDPGQVLTALDDAIRTAGGRILEGAHVRSVGYGPSGLQVDTWTEAPLVADAVVLATGAWLTELARRLGVRIPIHAGRGYSFTVGLKKRLEGPLYFPGVRVAITPYRDAARIAGTMEITKPDAAFRQGRLEAIARSVKPLFEGVNWDDLRDPWVGPRPLTSDGLPVIGGTRLPGVHVAGGHGMWGLTLGPVTGKLLAEQIMTGAPVRDLAPFDPQRRGLRERRAS